MQADNEIRLLRIGAGNSQVLGRKTRIQKALLHRFRGRGSSARRIRRIDLDKLAKNTARERRIGPQRDGRHQQQQPEKSQGFAASFEHTSTRSASPFSVTMWLRVVNVCPSSESSQRS